MRRWSAARRALPALLAVLLAAWPGFVAAQAAAPDLEITAAFSTTNATIGDRLSLVVSVRHVPDVLVTPVRPEFTGAEVIGNGQPVSEPQSDGSVVTSSTFQFQVFAVGDLATRPVSVRWLRADGSTGVVEVEGATLTIVPVRAAGDEALRPLKPVTTIAGAPPAWIRPAAIAAGVLLLLALLAFGVRRWRHRRRDPVTVAIDTSPEAAARARLDELRGVPLRDDSDEAAFQAYYGTIAAVVREYLGVRFGFNARALTTLELERRMTSYGVDRWQARLVGGLLDRCDHAVYAREYPEAVSADHDLTVAYEIIELSRPRAVAEELEAAS